MRKYSPLLLLLFFFSLGTVSAQEETPFIAYDVPSQNLLKFNRFLLNPTFSTVREDKSYINLFHRNQSVSFDDNYQTYFLSYSGRIGDRSGVGLSLYTQREGLIDNFGLLANYAYGVKLSDKSNFTFGANFSYYNSGFNEGRANPVDDDPLLNSLDDSALITFQPGFNLSYGNFDLGMVADNLFDYNLKTSESITQFDEKTFTGHLQYTHQFKNSSGILESGRLMPLARVRNVEGEDISLSGSMILDLPKLGWLQAGYDEFYGAAAGIGFNLNKRLSLGYTVEKGLSNNFENFGVNHEISLAYSFVPNLTEDRVLLEKNNEDFASNEDKDVPIEELSLTEKDLKIAELEKKLAENDAILDELLFRQDSIERTRKSDLERRFNTVMKMVRRETKGDQPEVEEKAKQLYFQDVEESGIARNISKTPISNSGLANTTASNRIIKLKDQEKSSSVAQNDEETKGLDRQLAKTSTTKRIKEVRSLEAPSKERKIEVVSNETKKDKTVAPKKYVRKTKFRDFSIPDVESGHYLIANVYKGTKYMNAFIESLKTKGVEADYFTNPRNGMNYVYLKSFGSQADAIAAHKSNLNGEYHGDTWVMRVKGIENTTGLAQNTKRYDDSVLQKNVVNNGVDRPGKPSLRTYTIDGIGSGFYIIANVFANPNNATRFVKELNAKGLNAGYFINPENKYRYVYLKKHQEWTAALTNYYSKLNDEYHDPIWIMRVKPNRVG
ncbi:MAG: PorP/SprF family type IX secretion system membrane protein [Bacteroidota bacterium]